MVTDTNFAQVYGAGQIAGKKPTGWFSRRHQTPEEHNHAVSVYGNRRARKARRVERAKHNATHLMIDCMGCGSRHRKGRCAGTEKLSDADQLLHDLLVSSDLSALDPAGTRDDKSLMKSLNKKTKKNR